MFSGLSRILFGPPAEQQDASRPQLQPDDASTLNQPPDTNNQPNSNNNQTSYHQSKPSQLIISAIQDTVAGKDTSALIEQTLNKAASRFTEQLLSPSTSIELLQSQSRHLLPTLNEQQQDLLSKSADGRPADPLEPQQHRDAQNDDDDDDDDDTWELLDLVDKRPTCTANSPPELACMSRDDVAVATNDANSILLQAQRASDNNSQCPDAAADGSPLASAAARRQGQKLKVSFETPDLVRVESEEIEHTGTIDGAYIGLQLDETSAQTDPEHKLLGPSSSSFEPSDLAPPKKPNITTSISNNHYNKEYEQVEEGDEDDQEEEEGEDGVEEVGDEFTAPNANKPASRAGPRKTTTTTAKINALSNFNSGNDSHSDLTEMDESWYVTPPPCFTGSNFNNFNKFKSPKATNEAAIENALIEHPSIYISSNLRQQESRDTQGYLAKDNAVASSDIDQTSNHDDDDDDEADEIMIHSINEDDLDDIDDEDAVDDDVAQVSEIDADEEEVDESKEESSSSLQIVDNDQVSIQGVEELDDTENLQVQPLHSASEIATSDNAMVSEQIQCSASDSTEEMADVRTFSRASTNHTDSGSSKRAPLQVRPIEPERQPGWQLRKKRSKRRTLSAISVQNPCNPQRKRCSTKTTTLNEQQQNQQPWVANRQRVYDSSARSASRDSPAFINRIGSSIVANLNNLANGLPIRSRVAMEEAEKMSQTMMKKSTSEMNMLATQRTRLSKNYLDRQNDCVRVANSNRRADRRLKMHTTPNGYSVNRKVQTNFH